MRYHFNLNISVNLILKIAADSIAVLSAFIVSFLVRFSFINAWNEILSIIVIIPFYLLIRIVCLAIFKLYSIIWRYSGIHALSNLIKGSITGTIIIIILDFFVTTIVIPRSIVVMDCILVIFFTGGLRLLVRQIYSAKMNQDRKGKLTKNVLIYGAGDSGELLLRSLKASDEIEVIIVGFIDDDKHKIGKYIDNKRVLGNRDNIGEIARKYNIKEIFFSIPSLAGYEIRELLKVVREKIDESIVLKTIPVLSDLINGSVSFEQLRKFELKDILRRKPVSINFDLVNKLIKSKKILVVGGGGSIGSELCRQISIFKPEKVIVLDNCELNCYIIEEDLRKEFPDIDLVTIVADACDEEYTEKIFSTYNPDIVFHAAAYKHVPMMELNPWAAVRNNLTGTLVLNKLCLKYNVDKFVLISTDKAVNPTSVMGATKRICELITLMNSGKSDTKYMTVRFGNVLGSSGSVINKFKNQINQGGPLTVTDKEMTRFFMLVSEAVELVLQAGALGDTGKIYVLDMGEPIKIEEIAKYMIELSGLKVNEDIKIEYVGLRPGEKLHESLLLVGQEKETKVPNLLVLDPNLTIDNGFMLRVQSLLDNLYSLNHKQIRQALKDIIPEYDPRDNGFKVYNE